MSNTRNSEPQILDEFLTFQLQSQELTGLSECSERLGKLNEDLLAFYFASWPFAVRSTPTHSKDTVFIALFGGGGDVVPEVGEL